MQETQIIQTDTSNEPALPSLKELENLKRRFTCYSCDMYSESMAEDLGIAPDTEHIWLLIFLHQKIDLLNQLESIPSQVRPYSFSENPYFIPGQNPTLTEIDYMKLFEQKISTAALSEKAEAFDLSVAMLARHISKENAKAKADKKKSARMTNVANIDTESGKYWREVAINAFQEINGMIRDYSKHYEGLGVLDPVG